MPTMCQPQDKQVERAAFNVLNRRYGIWIIPTDDIHASCDGEWMDEMFFEVKRRKMPHDRHSTIHLSKVKWDVLKSKPQAYFLIQCDDGLFMVDVTQHGPVREKVGGRWDRGLVNDVETLVDIPVSSFERMD